MEKQLMPRSTWRLGKKNYCSKHTQKLWLTRFSYLRGGYSAPKSFEDLIFLCLQEYTKHYWVSQSFIVVIVLVKN